MSLLAAAVWHQFCDDENFLLRGCLLVDLVCAHTIQRNRLLLPLSNFGAAARDTFLLFFPRWIVYSPLSTRIFFRCVNFLDVYFLQTALVSIEGPTRPLMKALLCASRCSLEAAAQAGEPSLMASI